MSARTRAHGHLAGLRQNIFLELSDEYPDLTQPTGGLLRSPSLPVVWSESSAQIFSGETWANLMQTKTFETSTSVIQGNSALVALPGDIASNSSQIDVS